MKEPAYSTQISSYKEKGIYSGGDTFIFARNAIGRIINQTAQLVHSQITSPLHARSIRMQLYKGGG